MLQHDNSIVFFHMQRHLVSAMQIDADDGLSKLIFLLVVFSIDEEVDENVAWCRGGYLCVLEALKICFKEEGRRNTS